MVGPGGEVKVNYGGILLFQWLPCDRMVGPDIDCDFH